MDVVDRYDPQGLYDAAARARLVEEPPKRVEAPIRTPFERDRARVVHAASSRRLAAKTQVVGPDTDDFVRDFIEGKAPEVEDVDTLLSTS